MHCPLLGLLEVCYSCHYSINPFMPEVSVIRGIKICGMYENNFRIKLKFSQNGL